MSVCLPAYPQHGNKETFELSLRQTLQIDKNMQQACKEGRGKEARWRNGAMQFIPSSGEMSKSRAAHTPEQSPLIPTPLPRLHAFGRISMVAGTYTAGIPCSSNPSVTTTPWAGKPLPSLSRPSSPPAPREGSEDEWLLILQLTVVTGLHLQPPRCFQRVLSPALSDTHGVSWEQPGGGSHQR